MNSFLFTIRNAVYSVLFMVDQLMGRKNPITVFCYHSISSDKWRYGVSEDAFKQQVIYLLNNGYSAITTTDLKLF